MNELKIKRHNFDQYKEHLKEFSEKKEAEQEIDSVQEDGGFLYLFDHKVTGAELNRRLKTIQDHFIAVNKTNNEVIAEFRQIYNALDALDKDYIESILANVKAIEKTSNDVRNQQKILKKHHEKLADQQNELDVHQAEIDKSVANMSKIVNILKNFQNKLESYKHLTDIDTIWKDCKNIQNNIKVVSDSVTKLSKKVTVDIKTANNKNNELSKQVNKDIHTLRDEAKSFKEFFSGLSDKLEDTANLLDKQIPIIQETSSFAEDLKMVMHIDDVDSMWENINKFKETFDTIEKSLKNINEDILKMGNCINQMQQTDEEMQGMIDSNVTEISVLKKYKDKLNDIAHLNDVDSMWEDINKSKETFDTIEHRIKNINADILRMGKNIEEIDSFVNILKKYDHLQEIDNMWSDLDVSKKNIENINESIKTQQDCINQMQQTDKEMQEMIDSNITEISMLKEYKDKLGDITHLKDVDDIWKDVEKHTSQFIEGKKREEKLADTIQKNKDEMAGNIDEVVQTTNVAIEDLTKKVKYAYLIAGGATGLAIIELILLFVKVI